MRYWWVNQNQTYRHEVPGGYLWSPKLKRGGSRNPFYEFMREVAPGDVIFSFSDTQIRVDEFDQARRSHRGDPAISTNALRPSPTKRSQAAGRVPRASRRDVGRSPH
jgi:hypothetical protein